MLRMLLIFIGIAGVAGAAWLLAREPGSLVLEWRGFYVSTSVAVAVAVLVIFAAIVILLFWLIRGIIRIPTTVGRAQHNRRQRAGVKALSKGMTALAAGDAATARKQAARADERLDDRALTLLLHAQAAQLEGDEAAAERYFAALRDWPSTEFLGVRGLLTQAMKRQDWAEALALAKRAYRINRKSEWVVGTLFDLQKRMGHWADARETLKDIKSLGMMSRQDIEAEDANLLYKQSLEAKGPEAISFARKAAERPAHTEAAKRLARLLIDEGDSRGAAKRIESAWGRQPDPELASLYWQAKGVDTPQSRLEAARRLAGRNPAHPESRLMVGTAALEAGDWGASRDQLEPLASADPSPRVCRLMAELEEKQHGDLERARAWLMRASATEGATAAAPAPAAGAEARPAAPGPEPKVVPPAAAAS